MNEELSIKKQGESRTVVLLSQLQKKIETYDQEVRKLTWSYWYLDVCVTY